MNKNFLISTLVILIAGIGVGYLLVHNNQTQPVTTPMPQFTQTTPEPEITAPASLSYKEGIEYKNNQYDFTVSLPDDWNGYKIINSTWQGYVLEGSKGDVVTTTAPEILIRNPLYTTAEPTQDIPVMVFTTKQWNDVQAEKLEVSAAPFPPSELGRNSTYVFGLPPRYNYAFPKGYEEVEQVIEGKPLHAF